MHLIEVDVIGCEPPQAFLAGPTDVDGGEPGIVRAAAHPSVDLGGEHDLFAPTSALREPAPDDLLGHPLARLPAVDVGGVEEVEATVDRAIHDREALRLGGLGPEVHRAEA